MLKLTRSTPYQLWRGRNIKDEDWNKLVKPPLDFIEDDFDAGVAMLNDGTPRGCFLTQGGKEKSSLHWRCHFYLAGQQRILGRGSVWQCAKLYDYALFFFEKYRIRKAAGQFNFSKLDAESDMNFEPAIGQYLTGLESYLIGKDVLKLPVARVPDEKKKAEQRHRRTAAGALEHWIGQIQPHIFDIAGQNDETAKRLTGIEESLAEAHRKLDELRCLLPKTTPLTFSPGSR